VNAKIYKGIPFSYKELGITECIAKVLGDLENPK
jgi:hypothetical protein